MSKKPVKDIFGLWQIEGDTEFSGKYEIPHISGTNKIPENLVLFSNALKTENTKNKAIHFYELDENFVNAIDSQEKFDNLISNIFSKYESVILPDLSVYRDFPLALQIFQVYKSRALGTYLEKHEIPVIPNIRWADERSYEFAFEGVNKNSLISVGVLGGYRDNDSKDYFEKGFYEMLKRLEPSKIITYGNLPDYIVSECNYKNIDLIPFPTEISKRYIKKETGQKKLDFNI